MQTQELNLQNHQQVLDYIKRIFDVSNNRFSKNEEWLEDYISFAIKDATEPTKTNLLSFLKAEILENKNGYRMLAILVFKKLKEPDLFAIVFQYLEKDYLRLAQLSSWRSNPHWLPIPEVLNLYLTALILFKNAVAPNQEVCRQLVTDFGLKLDFYREYFLVISYSRIDTQWAMQSLASSYARNFKDPECYVWMMQDSSLASLLGIGKVASKKDGLNIFLQRLHEIDTAVCEELIAKLESFIKQDKPKVWQLPERVVTDAQAVIANYK
ncbi:MAG: hypothetical protein U0V74_17215 [Chitinophagales bacterium]